MTHNYWMMVERYPNLKEKVGGSYHGCEISSLLDTKKTCKMVNCLKCFAVGLSAFCLPKKEKERRRKKERPTSEWNGLGQG
jgi:hypothetical protein